MLLRVCVWVSLNVREGLTGVDGVNVWFVLGVKLVSLAHSYQHACYVVKEELYDWNDVKGPRAMEGNRLGNCLLILSEMIIVCSWWL